MEVQKPIGTGRRKSSVARVFLKTGKGAITINGVESAKYFSGLKTLLHQMDVPFEVTSTQSQFDVTVNVYGGGISGQAGAIACGIARALLNVDPNHRPLLKKAGLLMRDPRMKERKKYGQRGARARYQYSKR